MSSIHHLAAVGRRHSWNNVVVRRETPEPHQLFKHVRCDRHPAFVAFRRKILLWAFDDSNLTILDPIPASVADFHVSHPESGEHQEGYVYSWIRLCQSRCRGIDCGNYTCIKRPWL